MMYFKAKFKTETIGYRSKYIYPDIWDSQRISVLAYEEPERKGGEQEEYCVICVDDEYGKKLEAHPNFQKITKKEAESLVTQWRRPASPESAEIDALINRLDEKATKELIAKLSKKFGIS